MSWNGTPRVGCHGMVRGLEPLGFGVWMSWNGIPRIGCHGPVLLGLGVMDRLLGLGVMEWYF